MSTADVEVALRELVAEVLGPPTRPEGVDVDVDVLSEPERLVEDRAIDSLDLIHLFTAIEDTFAIALAELPDAVDALTLTDVARLIVSGRDAE
jgi:acyl carrier protein